MVVAGLLWGARTSAVALAEGHTSATPNVWELLYIPIHLLFPHTLIGLEDRSRAESAPQNLKAHRTT